MRIFGWLVLLGLLALAGCTSNTDDETASSTVTTNAATSAQADDDSEENVVTSELGTTEESTDVTTPEEAAGLTESSLTGSTAPLVTSPDEIEPRAPIGSQALSDLLIDEVTGFEPVPEASADRFLDLEAASSLQPDPTEERPLLETRGFQGGWTKAFRDGNNNVLITTVYDFVSALEADFYLEDGTITIIGDGGTIFEVESIPDARGFRQESGEALVTYGITFTRNNQWFLIYLLGDPAAATPDIVLRAAEEQVAAISN